MDNILEKPFLVLSSSCDARARLGAASTFDLFMDLASEHAARLGVGYADMLSRSCYWVAVRTRVRFYRQPELGETVTAQTWPGAPGLAKSDRFYRLVKNGETLVEGRTEWAVQDLETGAIRRTDSYGYPDIEPRSERVCAEAFTRFRPRLEGERLSYTVRSTDIDMARHMNNVAYIRMLLGTFTLAELDALALREAEISYRRACYEGETLDILRAREGDCWLFRVDRPDGETAVQALFRVAET